MKIIETALNGIVLFENDVYADKRGQFFESYNEENFKELGIAEKFVQDNVSISAKNVLRGLHAQKPPFAQGKFCQVLSGAVIDYAVDVRSDSMTFGHAYKTELSSTNRRALWIPPGFAHGFLSLVDGTLFHYKCNNYYSIEHEIILSFSEFLDQIGLDPIGKSISEKDKVGMAIDQIRNIFFENISNILIS